MGNFKIIFIMMFYSTKKFNYQIFLWIVAQKIFKNNLEIKNYNYLQIMFLEKYIGKI